jgi:hypothetical protein
VGQVLNLYLAKCEKCEEDNPWTLIFGLEEDPSVLTVCLLSVYEHTHKIAAICCDLTNRRAGERATDQRGWDESIQLQGCRVGHCGSDLPAEVSRPLSCLLP